MNISLSMKGRRVVTICNHNFSEEGIYHPDRILDEYDLLYMQKGEWNIIEDGITYHLTPGQLLVLEPGKHHYSTEKCSPMMRNVYIHFSNSSDDIPGGSTTQNAPGDDHIAIGKLTDCSGHPEVLHLFEKVIEAFFIYRDSDPNLRCSIYLEELLLRLSEINDSQSQYKDILIQEIIHRFHCNPDRFFSPPELADSYHVSVRTVSGRFKKETGISIHQYQLNLKLDMAYDALPFSPNRPLRDIAKSYGFYDEFQFSKLFKRRFGMAPSERK